MCRSIHTLYNLEPATSDEEVRAAAVQYVRKISGFSKPSQANEAAFALLAELVTAAPPRDREVLAERARARGEARAAARVG